MSEPQNLVLTGFMATGKSTVGPLVAEHLGLRFVDGDRAIETRVGRTIAEIFADGGEARFREEERATYQALSAPAGCVIATGGGALIDPVTKARMESDCVVVCLWADETQLAERLEQNQDRPLASKWRALLSARTPVYRSLPHHVDTTGKTPIEVAHEVAELWKRESTSNTRRAATPSSSNPDSFNET